MSEPKYLSIAEFASVAGCSKQAVYQRLAKSALEPFVLVQDGKKTVSTDAIKLFKTSTGAKTTLNNKVEQDLMDAILKLIEKLDSINNDISLLNSSIDSIKNQLSIKSKVKVKKPKEKSEEQPEIQPDSTVEQPKADKKQRLQIRIFKIGEKDKPIKCFSSYDRQDLDNKANAWLLSQGFPTYQKSDGKSFRWEV